MTVDTDDTSGAQALIMAGGRGERLFPLTASRPKPAVAFGGVFRIIDFTLSNCLNSGMKRALLLTEYRHEELHDYIQQSWSGFWTRMGREQLVCLPPGRDCRYRGTADAVFQNIAGLGREEGPVLILSADHLYRMDYRKLLRYHSETNADLTVATVERPLTVAQHFGVVEVDSEHRVAGFQEKPLNPRPIASRPAWAHINMGVYAFKRDVLMQALRESREEGAECDFGRHIIPSLVRSAHVQAYDFRDGANHTPGYWRDIGTLESYYEASMDLFRPETPFDPYANEDWPVYPACRNLPAFAAQPLMARLHSNCRIRRSVLSPGVRVECGSLVESSVLMPRVWVGKDARIRNSIIEEGVHIPDGFQIGFDHESDRKQYFVTGNGIAVVCQTPQHTPFSRILPKAERAQAR